MKKFKIKYQENNSVQEIVVVAENKDALKLQTNLPLNIIAIKELKQSSLVFVGNIRFLASEKELVFMKELSMLLEAKLTFYESLKIVHQTQNDLESKKLSAYLIGHIEKGKNFESLFLDDSFFLSKLSIAFFRLSSKSGDIAQNIRALCTILILKNEQIKKLKSALVYPAFLIGITFGVMLLMFMYVIPEFKNIFQTQSHTIPLLTKILFYISENIWIFFAPIGGLVGALLVVIYQYYTNKSFQKSFDYFVLKRIPILSGILLNAQMYIWFLVLYEQMRSKFKLQDALAFSQVVITNSYFQDVIDQLILALHNGKPITHAMQKCNLFNVIVLQMMHTAEQTNNYEGVFEQLLGIHKTKLNDSIKLFVVMFEPIFMLIMATFILCVILGIFIPVWDFAKLI